VKKYFLLVALAAFALFIAGCTTARLSCTDHASVSAYLQDCNNQNTHKLAIERDRCIAFAGKLCKSADICDGINTGAGIAGLFVDATSANIRNDCLQEVAKSLAEGGDEAGALNACNLIRASSNLPFTAQFVSINKQAQDQCKFDVAKLTGDVSICTCTQTTCNDNQIQGVCLREQCLGEFDQAPISPQCPNPRNLR